MKPDEFPKIKFTYDQEIDLGYAIHFLSQPRSERRLAFLRMYIPEELDYALKKGLPIEEQKEIAKKYVSDYYKENSKELKKKFESVGKDWEEVRKKYFDIVAKLFNNHPWPDGDYKGFGTIFHCYPRFVSEKIFLFPLNHRIPRYANKVIAHEMLHFIFFDYIEKKYGLEESSVIEGREENYIWKVSEAFNSIMERWGSYQELFKIKRKPYAETMELYELMDERWQKSQDIGELLDKFLKS